MSWNFSPVLVAAFLEECCSDTDQSVLSNTTPTPDQYYWPDKPTEHSRLSRFGTTCAPFEGSHGAELLTWFLAGFPARTSALPEPEPESTEREADSGARWPGSLAKYDRDTCSWKTAQRSLLGDSEPSLVTWPRSGLMLDGQCWELPRLTLTTTEKESGYWPTPTATAYKGWSQNHNRADSDDRLDYTVEREAFQPGQQTPPMRLSPDWTEWLMGWPIGHTDLKPLGMDRFREYVQQHGECLTYGEAANV